MNPQPDAPVPVSLKSSGPSLVIEWADGVVHRLPWAFVRTMCPCATCRLERDKPKPQASVLPVLSAAEAQPLRVLGMRPVGNYAYGIQFSDGHSSGIYSLEYLRTLGEQAPQESAAPQPGDDAPASAEPG